MCIIPTYVFPNYNVQWSTVPSVDVKVKTEVKEVPLILDFGQVYIKVERIDKDYYFVTVKHNIYFEETTFVLTKEEMKKLVSKLIEVV